MSTLRNTRDISTPRHTRKALGDITNNVTDEAEYRKKAATQNGSTLAAFTDTTWLTLAPSDEAEYREQKKATAQNSSTLAAFADTMWLTLAPSGIDENAVPHDENTPNILANGNVETDAYENNHTHVSVGKSTIRGSALSDSADDARRKKRSAQQRKRRAELTDQQREVVNRKQREYRARGKATEQNHFAPRARGPCTVSFGPLPTPVESDDDDDDCVMLDGDPNKSVAVSKEVEPSRDAAKDELKIVVQKGEIACRDFPHPRHLRAALPFSTSSHASHCNMVHHCHAADKDSKWKELRQSKNERLPNPEPSLPQHFNRSVTTGPSQYSVNAAGFSGRFVAPSPMPSTIPSYGSQGAQVAPPLYTSSNGNHLQPSVPSYGLVQPARPHASQPAQVSSLGGHVSAETFQSYPPHFPVGAPMGSQGHQYRPPSYPQLATNTAGVPLSRYSSPNALAQGTQRPQVPSPGIMSKESLANLARQYPSLNALAQETQRQLGLLAQGGRAYVKQSYVAATSQIVASSGHNSSNHAPGATVLSSAGSVQIQQPLPQLKPGTTGSSSSARIQQPLCQLKPGTSFIPCSSAPAAFVPIKISDSE